MAARRLIFAMLALLVLSSVVAALVPVDRSNPTTSTETTPSAPPPRTGALVERTIHVGEGGPERIVVAPGDQLVLTVSSARSDQVELRGLGEVENLDPDADARFDLVPFDPGHFAIRLLDARETIGTIVVSEPGRRHQGTDGRGHSRGRPPSSSASPGSSTAASTSGASSAS